MDKDSVVRKFRTTADDGKTYNVTYYNLDMIISLGYRIKSVNRKLLTGAGSVSHKQALEKAKSEYRKYQATKPPAIMPKINGILCSEILSNQIPIAARLVVIKIGKVLNT